MYRIGISADCAERFAATQLVVSTGDEDLAFGLNVSSLSAEETTMLSALSTHFLLASISCYKINTSSHLVTM